MDIEDFCMQLSLKKTIKKISSLLLVLITVSSCIEDYYYSKKGKPFFIQDLGIRLLKSDDGTTTEIDGFEMNKEIIKQDIWESNYFIIKNKIFPTDEMYFFKKYIIPPSKYLSTSYDSLNYYKKIPNLYTHIKIPTIDYTDDTERHLNLCYPKEIVLNTIIENEYIIYFAAKESLSTYKFNLDFVVSDIKAKTIFDEQFYEKYQKIQDVVLTLNIWPLEKENFVVDSKYFLEKWTGDHFEFKYPSDDLCQKFESFVYYHEDNNIVL